MLISNVREDFPYLILDKEGNIIGGLAFAINLKLQQGRTTIQIARLMGYKTDRTIRLLVDLYKADVKVRKAVVSGKMTLKSFETIRRLSASEQTAVIEEVESNIDEGEEAKFTKANLRRAANNRTSELQPILVVSDEPSVIQQLNALKNQLQTILLAHGPFGSIEKEILKQIQEIAHV